MKIYLERTERGLAPVTDEDRAAMRRIPVGDLVVADHRGRRNGKLFRKFHALVNALAEGSGRTPDAVRLDLKIRAGHYDEHITQWGEVVYVPRSLSYASTDPAAFEAFYKRAVEIAGTEFGYDVEAEGFA